MKIDWTFILLIVGYFIFLSLKGKEIKLLESIQANLRMVTLQLESQVDND